MDDNTTDLDRLTLPLDDPNSVSAMTLTTLLNSGVEEALSTLPEALSTLSPAQLIQLERSVQKFKKLKTNSTPAKKPKKESSTPKRRFSYKDEEYSDDGSQRASGGQYLNLPASTPLVELRDGTEWLVFTYSTKGVVQEYTIRTDIDHIHSDDIPDDFKSENCVYPRALCARDQYVGNRWEYETICNDLAWRLTWINANVLAGKRGLIQRAVDSYRNRYQESRSRRVVRQEKLCNGTLRRRTLDPDDLSSDGSRSNKYLNFQWSNKGVPAKCRIRIDIENVDINEMDETFRRNNCIYPRAIMERESYGSNISRWEYENACNELAWKLAWLNASKLAGKKPILQKAVDAFRSRFDDSRNKRYKGLMDVGQPQFDTLDLDVKNAEFSEMVANTLQQALSAHDLSTLTQEHIDLAAQLGHDEMDELHPRTVSTAELLSNLG